MQRVRWRLTSVASLGSAGELTGTSSILTLAVAQTSTYSSQKPSEDVSQKREQRLMKNREAARECRRKKKEYVKCLEDRVAVLENQNKTLIEELRAMKDIYRHKME
ncbi:cyclic AMP-responsive element-binding protein 1-like isoform X2 [Phyllopteryx taeniolatus]|uniref:cyclic AMP-responsive element-binding protein 1-like isoform X2 n=1 Tax=Phyllopteryx taeniolatus TaxID=161469 RepID=UPI002AD3CF3D|nr:cyclic AMP-responsive element-binding protein 1-like isoform X2 [Phyllopteryx taeniolatus]